MKKVFKFFISMSVILLIFFLFDFIEELETSTLVIASSLLAYYITILWDVFEKAGFLKIGRD